MKEKFPKKTTTDLLEDEINDCQKLIEVIEKEKTIGEYPKVKEKLRPLEALIEKSPRLG